MLLFWKLCSSKTMANKSKNTFALIRSRLFLLAIIYNGLWHFWLVLAHHFSERAVSLRSNRLVMVIAVTPFCRLAYERYWDPHGLPFKYSFKFVMGLLVPVHPSPRLPFPGSINLQIPLKHRTTLAHWDLGINGCLPLTIRLKTKWYITVLVVLIPVENFREQGNISVWKGSPVFPDGIFHTEIRVPVSSKPSLIPVSGIRGRFAANGKHDSAAKFISPEFCLPLA